ncbi:MAG TPA: hypothetical protein VG735_10955 [Caulobacterales bacterium]|nr:hypothetical protein [Caulobacterales bacterium]
MRVLIAMAFGVLMAAFATMASAQAAPVGVWRGIGLQVDSGGKESEWTIDLRIKADGSATIEYPSLKCGGALARLPSGGYRETITHGNCVTGGTIGLVPMSGKLIWYWTAEDTPYRDINATAVLFAAGVA